MIVKIPNSDRGRESDNRMVGGDADTHSLPLTSGDAEATPLAQVTVLRNLQSGLSPEVPPNATTPITLPLAELMHDLTMPLMKAENEIASVTKGAGGSNWEPSKLNA